MGLRRGKTISEKIKRVQYELNAYGHKSIVEMEKIYFAKKLNKEMRLFEESIKSVSKHVLQTILDKEVYKEVYRK